MSGDPLLHFTSLARVSSALRSLGPNEVPLRPAPDWLWHQLDFPQGYAYPFVRVNHEVILARQQVRTGLRAVYDRSMSPSVREWHNWLEAKDIPKPRYDFCDSIEITAMDEIQSSCA